MQLEKYKSEAEKLRKRIAVLEEEQEVEVQQVEAVEMAAENDYPPEKEELPTKDKKVIFHLYLDIKGSHRKYIFTTFQMNFKQNYSLGYNTRDQI